MGEPYRSKFIKGMKLSGHSFAHISAAGSSEDRDTPVAGRRSGAYGFQGIRHLIISRESYSLPGAYLGGEEDCWLSVCLLSLPLSLRGSAGVQVAE